MLYTSVHKHFGNYADVHEENLANTAFPHAHLTYITCND